MRFAGRELGSQLKINYKKLAADLNVAANTGQPIKAVMIAQGFSENTANRGWAEVPAKALRLMSASARGKHLQQLGTIRPADQEKLVRGRLVHNVIEGKDAGAMSARALGSDKRVSMWQPDMRNGVVILEAPRWAIENREALLNAPEE